MCYLLQGLDIQGCGLRILLGAVGMSGPLSGICTWTWCWRTPGTLSPCVRRASFQNSYPSFQNWNTGFSFFYLSSFSWSFCFARLNLWPLWRKLLGVCWCKILMFHLDLHLPLLWGYLHPSLYVRDNHRNSVPWSIVAYILHPNFHPPIFECILVLRCGVQVCKLNTLSKRHKRAVRKLGK